jgi:hypothetical protein
MSEWIGIIGLKAGLLILGFLISNITAYSAFRRYKILNNGKSLLSPLCFGALGMVDVWSFRKKEISDPEFQKYRMNSSIVHCCFASANEILKQVQNDGLRPVAKSISEPTRQLDRFTAPSLLREGRGGLPFSFKIGCSVLANPTLLKSLICILQSLILKSHICTLNACP